MKKQTKSLNVLCVGHLEGSQCRWTFAKLLRWTLDKPVLPLFSAFAPLLSFLGEHFFVLVTCLVPSSSTKLHQKIFVNRVVFNCSSQFSEPNKKRVAAHKSFVFKTFSTSKSSLLSEQVFFFILILKIGWNSHKTHTMSLIWHFLSNLGY